MQRAKALCTVQCGDAYIKQPRLMQKISTDERKPWWNILSKIGALRKGGESASRINHVVDVVESDGSLRRPLCNIELLNNG